MPAPWRLLDTRPRPAAENMALDQALLEARSARLAPNTLRFLQFDPPAVLVGYHQAVEEEVRLAYCREQGIDINRRITGGGALYFDRSQIGWEVVAGKDTPGIPASVEPLYAVMARAAVAGLRRLGVEAAYRPRNDIEVRGRKISGTGGTDLGAAFLFQGTLLVDFDVETMLRALRLPVEKLQDKEVASYRERVTCLREELGRVPAREEILAALQQGFAETLGVTFLPGPLLPEEEILYRQHLAEMAAEHHVYGLRRRPGSRAELRGVYRAPGGLIRTTLVVDRPRRRLQQALITGDFFAFPKRTIPDLEAHLRGAPAEPMAVAEVVARFFAEARPTIPGVEPQDLARALGEALAKLDYPNYGIPAAEVNAVATVVRPLPDLPQPQMLLLPYCAKLPACKQRLREGCARCGRCGVGEGFALGARYGLHTLSIQSYEHLEDTLRAARAAGVRGFVGCRAPWWTWTTSPATTWARSRQPTSGAMSARPGSSWTCWSASSAAWGAHERL